MALEMRTEKKREKVDGFQTLAYSSEIHGAMWEMMYTLCHLEMRDELLGNELGTLKDAKNSDYFFEEMWSDSDLYEHSLDALKFHDSLTWGFHWRTGDRLPKTVKSLVY
tara:strand:+ start:253 stop:579 length:327 start_codon:yes stop_codon:yes gene_type:complete